MERDGHERLAVVNVGDSRTYVLQDGILQQITRDHLRGGPGPAGEITADEARVHPQRHIVTRALGIEPDVQVDAWEAAAVAGDRYLICSDGLFNEIDDGQISAVLTGTPTPGGGRHAGRAGQRGRRSDNITVIVLDVTGDTPPLADREAEPVVVDLPDTDRPPIRRPASSRPRRRHPVGLASPTAPPVGGWLDDDPAPRPVTPVPPPVSPPEPPPPPTAEPRRHRVTVRSVLFVVAVLAILGIAFGGITFYGRSGYYVGFVGDQVAVYKGQKGGILWVDPTLDGTYPLRRDQLTPAWQQNLDRTISFTSRAAADAWFDTLRSNPAAVTPPVTTTLAPPSTVAVDTTTTAAATAPSGP